MRPKERQFETEYASIFNDPSVVTAYEFRPPYPPGTFDILMDLIDKDAPVLAVLDAGCGPGQIARGLVQRVDRVDAVDIADRLMEVGRRLPNGDDAKIHWIHGAIEEAELNSPYALIVTATSLHWMHWETVMARFHASLSPNGFLAVVDLPIEPTPWNNELSFIGEFSMNKDFRPYSTEKITDELENRGLFEKKGTRVTKPLVFRQSIDDYIESFHARNGLSRDRMDVDEARSFNDRMRELVSKHRPTGDVELQVAGRVIWGRPLPVS